MSVEPKGETQDPSAPSLRNTAAAGAKTGFDARRAIVLSVVGVLMLVALGLATCSGVAYD